MNWDNKEDWQLHCHNTIQQFKRHHLLLKEQRPKTQSISLNTVQQIHHNKRTDNTHKETQQCSQKKRKRNIKKTS
jgi:hypothetical protein